MGTRNLSVYNPDSVPDASEMRFGIVVSDWNKEITWSLLDGAVNTLKKHGATENNIVVKHVPGSFELTLGAQFLVEYDGGHRQGEDNPNIVSSCPQVRVPQASEITRCIQRRQDGDEWPTERTN